MYVITLINELISFLAQSINLKHLFYYFLGMAVILEIVEINVI